MLQKPTPTPPPHVSAVSDAGLLPHVSKKRLRRAQSELSLSAQLDKLTSDVPRSVIFKGLRPSVLQKFDILRHVDDAQKMTFAISVALQALSSRQLRFHMAAALGRVSYFLSFAQKQELIEALIKEKRRQTASFLITQVIVNVPTRKEVVRLIRGLGSETILNRRSPLLREVHALCFLPDKVLALPLPKAVSQHVRLPRMLKARLEDLKTSLRAALKEISRYEAYEGLTTVRELRSSVKANLRDLQRGFREAESSSEKREVLNRCRARHLIEMRYVLKLSGSAASGEMEARQWSSAELKALIPLFRRCNENALLFTPRLYEVRRIHHFTDCYAGNLAMYYFESGLIEVSDAAAAKTSLKSSARERTNLASTLAHEFGHTFTAHRLLSEPIQPRRATLPDFLLDVAGADFLALSSWQKITRNRKIDAEGEAIILGDRHLPFERPVDIDGTLRVFTHDTLNDTVWSHRADAEFVEGTYCQLNPEEDWSESFQEYVMRPRRLIDHAPVKFVYFDSLFRFYSGNNALNTFLSARLALDKRSYPKASRVHDADLDISTRVFKTLSSTEQCEVLNALEPERQLLPSVIDSASIMSTSTEKLSRIFDRSLSRRPARTRSMVKAALATYRPAFLRALSVVQSGQALGVIADRKDRSETGSARQPIADVLSRVFGNAFSSDRFYTLLDPEKSKRLESLGLVERTAAIISEFAMGGSVRDGGLVKPHREPFSRLFFYDSSPHRLRRVSEIIQEAKLVSKATFIDTRKLSVEKEVEKLFNAAPALRQDQIHIFTLDDTLLSLGSRFRVIHKESGTVLLEVSPKEFHLAPDPTHWIRTARAGNRHLPLRSLEWDDSDFADGRRVLELLWRGAEMNRMFRGE